MPIKTMDKIEIIETKEKIGNREYIVTKTPILTDHEIQSAKTRIETRKGELVAQREAIESELQELDNEWSNLF